MALLKNDKPMNELTRHIESVNAALEYLKGQNNFNKHTNEKACFLAKHKLICGKDIVLVNNFSGSDMIII
jgi:hypothetical protein